MSPRSERKETIKWMKKEQLGAVQPALLEQQRLVKELVNAVIIRASRKAKVPPSDQMQQQLFVSLWAEIKDKNINIKQNQVKSLEKAIFKDIMKLLEIPPDLVIIALGVAQPYQQVVISAFKDRLLRKKRSFLSKLFAWFRKSPDDGDQTKNISQTLLEESNENIFPLPEEKSEIPHDAEVEEHVSTLIHDVLSHAQASHYVELHKRLLDSVMSDDRIKDLDIDKKKLKGLDEAIYQELRSKTFFEDRLLIMLLNDRDLGLQNLTIQIIKKYLMESMASEKAWQQAAKPAEVPCDDCTGTRLKALKSCLVCQTSYCQTHLEPHLTVKGLKRHQLIDAVENLESRMCRKHDKLLELFCKTDQTCVCALCSVLDHKNHECVPLREEYEGKKAELETTEAENQQMIQKRQLKIQEITESVKMSKDAADRQKAAGVQVFTALMESVERCLKEIEDKQEATEKQAEGLIKDLEQEISELMERSSEVEQLSRFEDHLHLLQSFSSLKAAPPSKDWTEVRVHPPSYEGTVGRAVAQLEETVWKPMMKKVREAELKRVQQEETQLEETQLEETQLEETQLEETQLEETLGKDLKKKQLEAELKRVQLEEFFMKDLKKQVVLKRVREHEVDVTLDADTANNYLILSDDGKQVYCTDAWKKLPDNPKRFSECVYVLGEQSFSSGKSYFEVQVKGKTDWNVGVARESINRKHDITLFPEGGLWSIELRNGNEYYALTDPPVQLRLHPGPEEVGVLVDYEEGLVSFYDVGAAALIYSFTGCSFTHILHPFFCPCNNNGGKNSAPLIICPVSQTESRLILFDEFF